MARILDQAVWLRSLYDLGCKLKDRKFRFAHPCVPYYRVTLPCTQSLIVHVIELNDPSFQAADAYIDACVEISRNAEPKSHIFMLGCLAGAGRQIPGAYLVEQTRIRLNPISTGFTSTSALLGLKGTTGILGQGLLRLYQMSGTRHAPALFYDLEAAINHLNLAAIGIHKC